MTDADLEVLSRFEAVWQRVMTGKLEETASRDADREALLQGLYEYWRGCGRMERCASGAAKRRLNCLTREAGELFHALQTECFLKTGDIYLTKDVCNFASYTPYNLRKLWNHAKKLADSLQNAADCEGGPVSEAGKAMAAQAEMLKRLIHDSLQ